MNIQRSSHAPVLASLCMRDPACASPGRIAAQAIGRAKRLRERVLASLAFVMLIVAWDATLRLDEQVAPPRVRVGHVDLEG